MERTLYLNEKKGLLVKRDGPSIWITEKNQAGKRVPARLVNMVFIIGNIKMESGVVTLFTENGVPVTFMNRNGEILSVVIPNHGQEGDALDLAGLLDNRQASVRYFSWVLSMKRNVSAMVRSRYVDELGLSGEYPGAGYAQLKEMVDTCRNERNELWRRVRAITRGFIQEMAIRGFLARNLDPQIGGVLNGNRRLGLVMDICSVLGAEADMQALVFARTAVASDFIADMPKSCVLSKNGLRKVITNFEERKEGIQSNLDRVTEGLFVLLREVLR